MKGLFLKDLYVLKKFIGYSWIFLLISLFEPTMLPVMSVIFLMLLGITTFSFDDVAKWDKYANVLPVTRKQIIGEKYVFILASIILVTLVNVIFYAMMFALGKTEDLKEIQFVLLMIVSAVVAILAIIYPLIIRFGVQKSRIMIFIITFPPGTLVSLLQQKGLLRFSPSEAALELIAYLSPLMAIILLIISYFISVRLYEKKEF